MSAEEADITHGRARRYHWCSDDKECIASPSRIDDRACTSRYPSRAAMRRRKSGRQTYHASRLRAAIKRPGQQFAHDLVKINMLIAGREMSLWRIDTDVIGARVTRNQIVSEIGTVALRIDSKKFRFLAKMERVSPHSSP